MAFQNPKHRCLRSGLFLSLAILAGVDTAKAADQYYAASIVPLLLETASSAANANRNKTPENISPRASTTRVHSAGAEFCSQFIRRSGPNGLGDSAALQWSLGYLTGSSEENSAEWTHSPGGPEGVALSLRRYCQSHADDLVGDAAAAIFEGLIDKQAQHCACKQTQRCGCR
jgi:hypothetical protein